MTPEDKARAVVNAWREFAVGDEVIVTEECSVTRWVGLLGVIMEPYESQGRPAFIIKLTGIMGELGFWPEELRHAD